MQNTKKPERRITMVDYLYYKKDFNGSIIPDEEQFIKNSDLKKQAAFTGFLK